MLRVKGEAMEKAGSRIRNLQRGRLATAFPAKMSV
jgi:hypothetical protein